MSGRFLSNSIFSILNNVIQLAVSLGSGFLIARVLGPSGKGELYLISQIYTVLQVFFLFGLSSALLFFLKKGELSVNQALTFSISFNVTLMFIFSILALCYSSTINMLVGGNVHPKFLASALVIAQLNIAISFIGYVLMVREEGIMRWSVVGLLGNVIYLVGIVTMVSYFSLGVNGALIALIASGIVRLILLSLYAFKDGFRFQCISWKYIKKLFLYGFSVFVGNLFLTTVFRIDVFFLNQHVSMSDIGVYSVAVNVSELLLLFPSALGVVLFPHLSGQGQAAQLQTMSSIGRLSCLLGFVGCILLLLVGYPFIYVVFGANFTEAFLPFSMLLPGLLAMTMNYAYSNFFSSSGQPYVVAFVFGLGLFVNAITNAYFIPKFGIVAAAVASSLSYFVITVGFIVTISFKYKMPILQYTIPNSGDVQQILLKVRQFTKKRQRSCVG